MNLQPDSIREARKQRINALVAEILSGNKQRINVLWEQVEELCAWSCRRILRSLPPSFCLEFDDLYNCGYIALHEALAHIDIDRLNESNFTTYFTAYLAGEIYKQNGLHRGGKDANGNRRFDPAISESSVRLDRSTPGKDGKATPASEGIPEYRVDPIAEVDCKIFLEQLRDLFEDLLQQLSDAERTVIRQKYYWGLDCVKIAGNMNISPQEIRSLETRALSSLRKYGRIRGLNQFVNGEINYYSGTGFVAFKSKGTSATENIALRRIELEDYYMSLLQVEAQNNGKEEQ